MILLHINLSRLILWIITLCLKDSLSLWCDNFWNTSFCFNLLLLFRTNFKHFQFFLISFLYLVQLLINFKTVNHFSGNKDHTAHPLPRNPWHGKLFWPIPGGSDYNPGSEETLEGSGVGGGWCAGWVQHEGDCCYVIVVNGNKTDWVTDMSAYGKRRNKKKNKKYQPSGSFVIVIVSNFSRIFGQRLWP